MEAAWIKNYGGDLYLQCTCTCIRVLDRRLALASKNDEVRRHRPGRNETTPPIQRRTLEKNCSSEHATAEA
uniref:Uncharacterized protein n=1 Tax=Angiostrongylus cantonensis TaxID=6313 RepID=A0A0K0D865_ANGCA